MQQKYIRICNYCILCISLLFFTASHKKVIAESTPSANVASVSATEKIEKNKQIEDLKERLATKVAELRQTTKKAISGVIKSVSVSSLTVETKERDIKLELTDDITVIDTSKSSKSQKTTEDLSDGAYTVIFGQYDKTLDILTARHIVVQKKPETHVFGVITNVDNKAYTIGLQTYDKRDVIIDFEKTTESKQWKGSGSTEKIGFSKIAVNDKLVVYGTIDSKDPNRISATRLLTIVSNEATISATPTTTTDDSTSKISTTSGKTKE